MDELLVIPGLGATSSALETATVVVPNPTSATNNRISAIAANLYYCHGLSIFA